MGRKKKDQKKTEEDHRYSDNISKDPAWCGKQEENSQLFDYDHIGFRFPRDPKYAPRVIGNISTEEALTRLMAAQNIL